MFEVPRGMDIHRTTCSCYTIIWFMTGVPNGLLVLDRYDLCGGGWGLGLCACLCMRAFCMEGRVVYMVGYWGGGASMECLHDRPVCALCALYLCYRILRG